MICSSFQSVPFFFLPLMQPRMNHFNWKSVNSLLTTRPEVQGDNLYFQYILKVVFALPNHFVIRHDFSLVTHYQLFIISLKQMGPHVLP